MLSPKERLEMRKAAAMLQALKNAEKDKKVIKCGANLESQFGKVVQNEQRLIDNGHFMKSAPKAKLDYMRESYKKAKKADNKVSEIVRVRKV